MKPRRAEKRAYTDLEFLAACSITPEPDLLEVLRLGAKIAKVLTQSADGTIMAFESCPNCYGRRHRDPVSNESICLTCAKLAAAEAARRLQQVQKMYDDSVQYGSEYRGHQVGYLNGQGWRYRVIDPITPQEGSWHKCVSPSHAREMIDRVAPNTEQIEAASADEAYTINRCHGCGKAANPVTGWCVSCGTDKFGTDRFKFKPPDTFRSRD